MASTATSSAPTPQTSKSRHSKASNSRSLETSSPISNRRKKEGRPRKEVSSEAETEYKIRDIIDEDSARYLIDWENDSQTGESFEPTWVVLHVTLFIIIIGSKWLTMTGT